MLAYAAEAALQTASGGRTADLSFSQRKHGRSETNGISGGMTKTADSLQGNRLPVWFCHRLEVFHFFSENGAQYEIGGA